MSEKTKNITASIHARLKNQAVMQGRPFAEILQYYGMERFLYRLSQTEYAKEFVLKGGLLFYVWGISLRRPTRDIDFRSYVSNNHTFLLQVFQEILDYAVPEDGIDFDKNSISIETTQKEAHYQGVRLKLIGSLGKARLPLQIDIGFSKKMGEEDESINYPNILSHTNIAKLKGYPKTLVIAEKFHAMIYYAELNSRLKDFYDIWLISKSFEIDGNSLQKALQETFEKRETELPNQRPLSFSKNFIAEKSTPWAIFLKKLELNDNVENDFALVVERIWDFLSFPLQNPNIKNSTWSPEKGWS